MQVMPAAGTGLYVCGAERSKGGAGGMLRRLLQWLREDTEVSWTKVVWRQEGEKQ